VKANELCKCGQPSTRGDSRRRYCDACWQRKLDAQCVDIVSDADGYGIHRCGRPGSFLEKGKRYCRQHAPSLVLAKRQARDAAWDAKSALDRRRRELQARREDLRDRVVNAARRYCSTWPPIDVALVDALDAVEAELEAKEGK